MTTRIVTDALLLRRTVRGEADLVVTLYTESHGALTAIAYSALRSKKRFAVLEAFHTLRIEADDGSKDLCVLREASIATARTAFLRDLDRMTTASRGLGWLRTITPARAPDAGVWTTVTGFLDTAAGCEVSALQDELAAFGLTLLRLAGLCPPPSRVRSGMSAMEVLRVVESVIKDHAG